MPSSPTAHATLPPAADLMDDDALLVAYGERQLRRREGPWSTASLRPLDPDAAAGLSTRLGDLAAVARSL